MTWSLDNSKNNEAAKIRWEAVPYMRGRVLDIGCGPYKCFPHFIGIDNGHHWGTHGADVKVEDGGKLDLFATCSCDAVFSSHLLEHFDYDKVPNVLHEWMRVIKPGGHLMLYLPAEGDYPSVGHPHANADHRWNVSYDKLVAAMEKVPASWDLVDYQDRHESDEYSHWFVFKKL